MAYIPHTIEDERQMLQTIGVGSIDELFREIPSNLRIAPGSLNLPSALDEHRLLEKLKSLARMNVGADSMVSFLGAGIYDRFIPASVRAIISRGEFLTSYTPYQPEVSQGYLQTIYEFQTMIADLYGMDIANASMYDGATSLAEAAIVAHGINGREVVGVSQAIHPHYRQVLETYCWAIGLRVQTLPAPQGATDFSSVDSSFACVLAGYPNFFGIIEDLAEMRKACDAFGCEMIVSANPFACSLLAPPGSFGADMVVGEGQSFGVAMGLGGPVVGLFSCKKDHVRRIPGRIVGRTKEAHGDKEGFVMTLRTREQDIRREKATSNICTNEALMALANTVYLSAMGKNGLQGVAKASVQNARYAAKKLADAGAPIALPGKWFDEFVVDLPISAQKVVERGLELGVLAGLPLGHYYKGMDNRLLVSVTEKRTPAEIESLAGVIQSAIEEFAS